jgi:hypothetical protein
MNDVEIHCAAVYRLGQERSADGRIVTTREYNNVRSVLRNLNEEKSCVGPFRGKGMEC